MSLLYNPATPVIQDVERVGSAIQEVVIQEVVIPEVAIQEVAIPEVASSS
jgi:hypothetical protein